MIDRKEIELLIRAQLKGGKDIESISKSITDLKVAIEQQSAAAKKGESSIDGLKASLAALKEVQAQLGGQADAIGRFERLAESVKKSEDRVEKARIAFEKYDAKIKEAGDATEYQQERLRKLTASFERAQTTLEKQRASYAEYAQSLRDAGIDTSKLADEQLRLRSVAADLGTTYAKGSQALASYADDVAKARAETAKLSKAQAELNAQSDRRAQSAAAGLQFAEDAAAQRRAIELAALRRDIEERTASAAEQTRVTQRDDGLRKTADDAEAAAKQFNSLARASNDLRPKVASIRDTINGIINPTEEVTRTLAGVEAQIASLAAQVKDSDGEVKDYRKTLTDLNAAQKALSSQAGLIDNFAKQTMAVRDARAEFVAARAKVAEYAAAVRQGGDAGATFVKPLADAQAKLGQTSKALREQIDAARLSRDALRSAGIATNDLTGAQQRLTTAAQQANGAVTSLKSAVGTGSGLGGTFTQTGNEIERAGKGFTFFNDEGRTTLSLVQRIRGQVLSLAAAYVGIFGAIQQVTQAVKDFKTVQGLEGQLAFALGNDPRVIAGELEYLREQANRLGVSFEATAKSYGKFSAAAVKSGAPISESRFIFESFAEAAAVLNLSGDQLDGIFNAIGQSFSKGKIQSEELRGQIGERLPGAFAFAQEALKQFYPDLNKALEEGKVGAENLVVIAESVRKAAAERLPASIKNLTAEQNRFNNAIFEFRLAIANAGFADAFTKLLRELTVFFKSPDGEAFAKGLGNALTSVVDAVRAVVKNFEELKLILGVIASLLAVKLFGTLLLSLSQIAPLMVTINGLGVAMSALLSGQFAASVTIATGAVSGLGVALSLVQKAMLILGTFLIGWQIGDYLQDKFLEVRIAGIALVTGFAKIISQIKFGFEELWADLPRLAENSFKSLINLFNNVFVRPFILIARNVAEALRLDGVVKGLDRAVGTLSLTLNTSVSNRVADIRRQAEEDQRRIRDIGDAMVADAKAAFKGAPAVTSTTVSVTPSPGKRTGTPPVDEKAIAKRRSEIDQLQQSLDSLESRIERAQTETLATQLDGVQKQYLALARQAAEIGGREGVAFAQRLAKLVEELAVQTAKKFNEKLLTEKEAVQSKVEQAEAAAGKRQTNELSGRLKAVSDQYAGHFRDLEALRDKYIANGRDTTELDALEKRMTAAQLELTYLEQRKFYLEQIKLQEDKVNDVIKARGEEIARVREMESRGEINPQQAIDQIAAIVNAYQPRIQALTLEAQNFARALLESGLIGQETFDAFVLKLEGARVSNQRLNAELDKTGKIINDGVLKGIDVGIDATLNALAELTRGTMTWGQAFKSVGKAILQVIAEVIRELIKAAIRTAILRAISGGMGGGGGGSSFAFTPPVAHAGGVIGRPFNRTRAADPSWFAGAPRYHSGGIVGLAPDEYPAILQKNEEVLAAGDPRNVMNGGGGSRGSSGPTAQRFVLIDDRSRMAEAMAGAEGEEVIIQHLRRNIPTIRSWVKG